MTERVTLIRGDGIAACCCARLLQGRGCSVAVTEARRAKLPAILVSASTQNLLADIFQTKDVFDGLPRIQKRIVAWGGNAPVALPHSAVVASEEILLERLWARTSGVSDRTPRDPDWTITTAKPADHLPREMHFGSRMAFVSEVELADEAERDACWVESVETGWLFLLATGNGRGSLISAGGRAEELLEKSRLTARQVRVLDGASAEFPAYPRITSELCGKGWLACGAAATSFDPLCGEGAGNAAREAILACAATQAMFDGETVEEVLAEYSLRLMLGFWRHLENCREFYHRDGSGTFWSSESALLEQGIAWTESQIGAAPHPRFRLVDFSLKRAGSERKI